MAVQGMRISVRISMVMSCETVSVFIILCLCTAHAFKADYSNDPQFPTWLFVPHGHRLQQLDCYLQRQLWEELLSSARF